MLEGQHSLVPAARLTLVFHRGDKHGFFITTQVVCSLNGTIISVQFIPGRMNDQLAYTESGWQDNLSTTNTYLLADGGYHDLNLITPSDDYSKPWNDMQKSLRSVVVHVNVHSWRYASQRVQGHSPELQVLCLMVIYNLASLNIGLYPLRSECFLNDYSLMGA